MESLGGYIVIKNGSCLEYNVFDKTHNPIPWDGFGNEMWINILVTSRYYPDTTYMILKTDAFTESNLKYYNNNPDPHIIFLISSVHYKNILPPNIRLLYSPHNDQYTVQKTYTPVPFENKINKVVWRGQSSNNIYYPHVRQMLVDLLKDDDRCDCKIVHGSWQKPFDPDYSLPISEQLKYKGIFVMDGGGWPGIMSWVLGSGCVPMICSIFLTGAQLDLVPWVHYVPIKSDMSDLTDNIDWVLTHDEACRVIIDNAVTFYNDKMNHVYVLEMLKKTMNPVQTFVL